MSPSHAKRAESTRATDLQNPSEGAGLEAQQEHETREPRTQRSPLQQVAWLTVFVITTESIYLVKTKL